jgi:hypothetical protein
MDPTGIPQIDRLLNPDQVVLPEPLGGGASGVPAVDRLLKTAGLSAVDTDKAEKFYQTQDALEAARRQARARGESASQVFRRKFMGFGDVLPTDWLPDAPGVVNRAAAGVGLPAPLTGGRVVGADAYQKAERRFVAGEATDEDLEAIAAYEQGQRTDQTVSKSFVGKLVTEMGGLGKIGTEMVAGGAAIGRIAPRLGAVGRAISGAPKPVAAAAAGTVPAVPVVPGLASRALSAGTSLAAKTVIA